VAGGRFKESAVTKTTSQLQEWERAEIARSAVQAALAPRVIEPASEYTRRRYLQPPAHTAYPLEFVFHLLGDISGQRVLDLGCGLGEKTLILALKGARLTAIDISADLIRLARQRLGVNRAPEADMVIASAHDLPFEDTSFDAVLGLAVLHHLDLSIVAREVARVLKAGGRAVFKEPVRNSRALEVLRRLIPHRAPDVSPFERPLRDDEIEAFCGSFRKGRSRLFALPPLRAAEVIGIRNHIDGWYRADRWMLAHQEWLGRYAAIPGVRGIQARLSSSTTAAPARALSGRTASRPPCRSITRRASGSAMPIPPRSSSKAGSAESARASAGTFSGDPIAITADPDCNWRRTATDDVGSSR
jgi:SAM-dependent methyltransferase